MRAAALPAAKRKDLQNMKRILIGTTTLSICLSTPALGATWHVDDSAPGGGSGANWSSPLNSLQAALTHQNLQPGDEIRVGQGTYKPTSGSNRSISFVLVADVDLRGGFAGYGATFPNEQNFLLYPTILSGDIGTADDYSDNSYHVVTADDGDLEDDDLVEGFTITKGNGNGSGDGAGGGGVWVSNGASPRFDRCTITANRAAAGEGPFDEETLGFAVPYGAGVKSTESSPVFTRCAISSNQNNDGTLIYGGGIVVQGESEDPVRLIDCHIINNRAGHGGGIAIKSGGEVLVVNSLFTGNTINPTGSPNGRPWGGGIGADKVGISTIINCTIVGNTAVKGGGIAQWDDDDNLMTMHSSIVWGNTASSEAPEIYGDDDGGTINIDYSDIRDRNGAGVVDPSPQTVFYGSGVIGENTTAHNPDFVGGGDYHLGCASACINKGHPTTSIIPVDEFNLDGDGSSTEPTPDLDLLRRIVGTVDMGVYENQAFTCAGDVDNDCDADVDDLIAVILNWGCTGSSCPGDIVTLYCGDGEVNVDDLIAVILSWGPCANCTATGTGLGADPESYEDCENICDSLEGEAWFQCMQACFMELCNKGHTEFCD
jgi:hypothetical protein